MKIYTKAGDGGETGLIGGARVPKDDPRIVACGELDEASAAIGAARALVGEGLPELLLEVQKDLFAIGARLADPTHALTDGREKTALTDAQLQRLEAAIDTAQARLPELRAFVLPGGAPAGSALHQARAVCRRAERSLVGLMRQTAIDPLAVPYLNRLSDLLFVLARLENHAAGVPEERW